MGVNTDSNILPFERSYVVIPSKLYAGFTLGSRDKEKSLKKLQGLARVGINHIINLIEPDEYTTEGIKVEQYEKNLEEFNSSNEHILTYERLDIVDMNVPSEERMKEILDSIDEHNNRGESVYVHCHGGFGRTGTVVGCYLKRHGMVNNENYHDTITHLRRTEAHGLRPSPQREIQHNFIKNWGNGH